MRKQWIAYSRIIIFIICIGSSTAYSSPSNTNEMVIFFGNGILTTEEDAETGSRMVEDVVLYHSSLFPLHDIKSYLITTFSKLRYTGYIYSIDC
jgi:hypothetical protein